MAGTIIDMSKIKQLLHLKKAGVSNRQIAKDLKWPSITGIGGRLSAGISNQADWKYYYYFYDEGNCSRDEIHRVRCVYAAD